MHIAFGRFSSSWKNVAIVSFAYLFLVLVLNPFFLFHPVAGSDDGSYVSHAFTIALDGDLNYSNEVLHGSDVVFAPSAHAPKHPIGAGIMAAPFVAAFSVFDRIEHHPVLIDHRRNAGSWSLFGFFIASAAWFIAGVWLYTDALRKAGTKIKAWEISLLIVAVGFPHYVLQRFTMAHAYEFAAIAIVFWSAVQIAFRTGKSRTIAEVLLVVGLLLTGLTRGADINVVMLPVIVWGLLVLFGRSAWPRFSLYPDVIVTGICVMIAAAIFIALSVALYDVPLPVYSATYGSSSPFPVGWWASITYFVGNLPLIWPLLTSMEYGLIYSAPVLVAGVAALVWHLWAGWRRNSVTALVVAVVSALFIVVPLYIVFVWRQFGDAYGYRYLFSLTPLCLMATVFFVDKASWNVAKWFRIAVLAASAWSCLGMVFTGASPELVGHPSTTALGSWSPYALPGYEKHIAESLVRPKVLVSVAAHRVPGFAASVVLANNRDIREKVSFGRFASATHYLDDIAGSSGAFISAIFLFCLIYPLCFVWLWEPRIFGSRYDWRKLARPRVKRPAVASSREHLPHGT